MAIIFDNRGRPVDGSLTIAGVTFQRQDRILMGLAADRPLAADAHAALPFAYYLATDTQAVSQTTGAAWIAASIGGPVSVAGSNLVESTQDETDAVANVHTFSAVVAAIEIANRDTVNDLTAVVNGSTIVVPPEVVWGPAFVSGPASVSVTVTGSASYLLNRYS